jgi:hypothetical protein
MACSLLLVWPAVFSTDILIDHFYRKRPILSNQHNFSKPQNPLISAISNRHQFLSTLVFRFPKPQAGGSNPFGRTNSLKLSELEAFYFFVIADVGYLIPEDRFLRASMMNQT